MNKFSKLIAATLITGVSTLSMADITGQVDVKLNVSTGCTIGGSKESGTINNFGTLNFGKTSGTWSNALSAEVQGNGGTLEVICEGTDKVPFYVAIDGGVRNDRSLKNVDAAVTENNIVKYNVYRDAARNTVYENNVAQTFEAQGSQPEPIPLFGAIKANPSNAVAQGDYADTLLVKVSF